MLSLPWVIETRGAAMSSPRVRVPLPEARSASPEPPSSYGARVPKSVRAAADRVSGTQSLKIPVSHPCIYHGYKLTACC